MSSPMSQSAFQEPEFGYEARSSVCVTSSTVTQAMSENDSFNAPGSFKYTRFEVLSVQAWPNSWAMTSSVVSADMFTPSPSQK